MKAPTPPRRTTIATHTTSVAVYGGGLVWRALAVWLLACTPGWADTAIAFLGTPKAEPRTAQPKIETPATILPLTYQAEPYPEAAAIAPPNTWIGAPAANSAPVAPHVFCPNCAPPGVRNDFAHLLLHPLAYGPFVPKPDRHLGVGLPLERSSWLSRPYSVGTYVGFVQGSPLIDGWVGQNQGAIAGLRLGWDFEHYWGCETRAGWSSVTIFDSPLAIAAAEASGGSSTVDSSRSNDAFLWDINLLYYPWGESTWRPYASIGLGIVQFGFLDRLGQDYQATFFGLPISLGLKYRHNERVILRTEITDNMAIGGSDSLDSQHNLSITAGLEIRFGGTRRAYWPYNPSRSYW